MAKANPHRIAILSFPKAQLAAVYGLCDLFETANRLHHSGHNNNQSLEFSVIASVTDAPPPREPYGAVIIPPSLQAGPPERHAPEIVAWARARHAQGSTLFSVCSGVFLVAEAGLLKGRPATTHWALKDVFKERFPDVALDTDRLIVDDGDLVTAGGVMAWTDVGLLLIDRLLSPTVMLETAQLFLIDPGGREQRFYATFSPTLTHGDSVILKVQHWLRSKAKERLTVTQMAAKATLGERTFLRRFQSATGLNPAEYLQHLRVGIARGILEQSRFHSVDDIAWRVGYEDPGAFRRVFKRIVGLSPSEYRRRFTRGE